MVSHCDHFLHNHVRLPSEFDVPSGRQRREMQLALHVEAVHESQELLRGVIELVLPFVRFFQVEEDLFTTNCSNVTYTDGWLTDSILGHAVWPMAVVGRVRIT